MKRILVFPGGSEIGLEINKSLRYIKDIEIFSAGSDVSNPAPFFFSRHFILPTIFEDGWIEKLNSVIKDCKIDYIFPAYDDIIVALAKNKERINANVISSPLKTCLITRSKQKTYELFQDILPTPEVFKKLTDIKVFPVFIKPDKGQGSKDAYIVNSLEELKVLLNKYKETIITEYLPGREFTIDCFSDRGTGLLFCEGRERIRIRNGITVNSKIVTDYKFKEYALKISEKLDLYGAWFFQLKEDQNGVLKLMEIGPRIAGTMALNRVRGINFPLLSIYEFERVDIKILKNNYEIEIDRALQNRYKVKLSYDTIYLDLDDTLIINKKVNLLLIKFLYQCINLNKKIIILTRHRENINKTLLKFKINRILFDKIIVIKENELKSNYIKNQNSIFIDDSFSERTDVANKCKIPTFDCSMVESLLEDRY